MPTVSFNPAPNAPVNDGVHGDVDTVTRKMRKYDDYLEELWQRFPDTYRKMREFMNRGSCKCGPPDRKQSRCNCSDSAKVCSCRNHRYCQQCPSTCPTYPKVEDTVRVYDIDPQKKKFEKFLMSDDFHISQESGFNDLKAKLAANVPKDHSTQSKGQPTKHPLDHSGETEENCVFADGKYRIITVAHLSPNIIRLLGGVFDISADFFNRHLPGTEAISGRLISRLPSTVQIDFDELYESNNTYEELFVGEEMRKGHQRINEAIKKTFLFSMGWDYFPVSKTHWQESKDNKNLSSGFEIVMQDDLKNVFQFNLSHRISVFSRPLGHPKTAIVIFYPMLIMEPSHDSLLWKEQEDRPIHFRSNPNMLPNPKELDQIIHNEETKPWETAGQKQPYATSYDTSLRIHVKRHFNRNEYKRKKIARRGAQKESTIGNQSQSQTLSTGSTEVNSHNSLHHAESEAPEITHRDSANRGEEEEEDDDDDEEEEETDDSQTIDHPTFVHLFAVPLFKMVAANWARLIVRRSFDLDLLEWRPKHLVTSRAIDEIKSRRVAITRHQLSINSALEVLRGLMLEELALEIIADGNARHKDNALKDNTFHEDNALNGIALHKDITLYKDRLTTAQIFAQVEGVCNWNRGRSNGLVAAESNDDSWQSIFWDYFELKASMDALEKRADKIQDGLTGLIQVVGGETASTLNVVGFMFSMIILPFTILATIYSSGLQNHEGGYMPARSVLSFVRAYWATFAIVLILMCVSYFVNIKWDHVGKMWARAKVVIMKCCMKLKDRWKLMNKLEKNWQPV